MTEPIKLELRNGKDVLHTFDLKPGQDAARWHSDGRVMLSGSITLVADKAVKLSGVELEGVPEAKLPAHQGYRPHFSAM